MSQTVEYAKLEHAIAKLEYAKVRRILACAHDDLKLSLHEALDALVALIAIRDAERRQGQS